MEVICGWTSRDIDAGKGIILTSQEGHNLNDALRFAFKATNNVAKYEALLVGL